MLERPILIRAILLDGLDEDGNARVQVNYAPGTASAHGRTRFVDPAAIVELPLSRAWLDIFAERHRQVRVEGWTPDLDDEHHGGGGMARAAACYAYAGSLDHPTRRERVVQALWDRRGSEDGRPIKLLWPWAMRWWKPKDRRRDLVRAGALIIAELERLDRARVGAGA
ncbi:hypothetical protein [Phenylobacterium sp.]|jgi:hypothetical protein|uniref:hypothetical protein n=1 Tax=Phenylobacterium sp. TaxID=1871053 RepID=UPI002F3FC52E